MRRSSAASIIAVAFGLACASNVAPQPSTKVYRVGWLATGSPPTGGDRSVMDFQQGLRDLRYVIDKNVTFEFRYASGSASRLADHAAELVRLPVDVTRTMAVPLTTEVPRNTQFGDSGLGFPAASPPTICFSTGMDSPVSAACWM